jgi:Uma2 family endonuclease
LRDRGLPSEPVPSLAPDLAVEVLSEGNTPGEMQRKLRDYFAAGVRLVWYVDLRDQTAAVYTGLDRCTVLRGDEFLVGGEVLPGFEVKLGEVLARAEQEPPPQT